MECQEQTRISILLKILRQEYSGYYRRNSKHDFLNQIDYAKNSNNIAYLMEHVKSLDKSDEYYIPYVKNCFAIYLEFIKLINEEFEKNKKNHVSLIRDYMDSKQIRILEIFGGLFVYEKEKADLFCEEIKNNEEIFFSEMVINIIRSYQRLKMEEERVFSNINDFTKYFNALFPSENMN